MKKNWFAILRLNFRAFQIGCSGAMNKKAQEEGYANGITDILRKKCASAIIEMEAITEDGYRKGMIDIFLEQGFTHLLHFCVVNYKIFFVFHFP